jgi:hypothetical protein
MRPPSKPSASRAKDHQRWKLQEQSVLGAVRAQVTLVGGDRVPAVGADQLFGGAGARPRHRGLQQVEPYIGDTEQVPMVNIAVARAVADMLDAASEAEIRMKMGA